MPNGDSLYDQQIEQYRRRQQRLEGNLAYREQRVRQSYGFDDPTDPFSRARMLERAYQQERRGVGTSMAARGQLYSGAAQRGQREALFGREQREHEARQEYADRLREITEGRAEAAEEFETSRVGAAGELLGRQQQAGPSPAEEVPGEAPGGAPGGGGATISRAEYERRLRSIRSRHGAGSPEVQRFRSRWAGRVR